MVPLILASTLTNKDSTLNPEFDVEASGVALFSLDIASMNKKLLGDTIANMRPESDRIVVRPILNMTSWARNDQ